MRMLLVAGLWLTGSAWDQVVPALRDLGHQPEPLTLPGQGDGAASATLDDQLAAVLTAIDAGPDPVVVGHSAACTLVWLAADARPERVVRAVMVGGFPDADGGTYADLFECRDGVVPFPGWDVFDGPDSEDLDDATKQRFAAAAIPVPEGVSGAVVRLRDERRYDVPVVVVCPEFTPAQARQAIDDGDVPELSRAASVELIDLDSGHWPMLSAPVALARVLAEATGQG